MTDSERAILNALNDRFSGEMTFPAVRQAVPKLSYRGYTMVINRMIDMKWISCDQGGFVFTITPAGYYALRQEQLI